MVLNEFSPLPVLVYFIIPSSTPLKVSIVIGDWIQFHYKLCSLRPQMLGGGSGCSCETEPSSSSPASRGEHNSTLVLAFFLVLYLSRLWTRNRWMPFGFWAYTLACRIHSAIFPQGVCPRSPSTNFCSVPELIQTEVFCFQAQDSVSTVTSVGFICNISLLTDLIASGTRKLSASTNISSTNKKNQHFLYMLLRIRKERDHLLHDSLGIWG